MACCVPTTPGFKRNRNLERDINTERRKRKVHLLLLGPGDAGKSTIFKQMKIIYLNSFPEQERKEWIAVVHINVVHPMKILLQKVEEFGYHLSPENVAYVPLMLGKSVSDFSKVNPEVNVNNFNIVQSLWNDKAIKEVYQRRNEFQLNDSADYFFANVERIAQPSYLPTEEDILRARVRTTGIAEISFEVDNTMYNMIDVGGQRSERRKWIHCFENVTALIFCVAISEYDQMLFEDDSVNRMHESLQLFGDVVNGDESGDWFGNTAVILFLNKKDLFEQKMRRIALNTCFPDYEGNNSYEDGVRFIKQKFLEKRNNTKSIYTHVTCATATDNITIVFEAVRDIVLKRLLENQGMVL